MIAAIWLAKIRHVAIEGQSKCPTFNIVIDVFFFPVLKVDNFHNDLPEISSNRRFKVNVQNGLPRVRFTSMVQTT